jgi:hypothetical protein
MVEQYERMSTEELFSELKKLEEALEQDLIMDGSGELSDTIHKGYVVRFDTIHSILEERGRYESYDSEVFDEDGLPF